MVASETGEFRADDPEALAVSKCVSLCCAAAVDAHIESFSIFYLAERRVCTRAHDRSRCACEGKAFLQSSSYHGTVNTI